ncbi:MAG: bifunctional folylpolyglutamate synthase/dihydrofolate synthase, partial [Clostridia bacterium]|nr:bifunctional folylpolyglutamate synthase/dihydrofolate synthase [Clostridia bacterium]
MTYEEALAYIHSVSWRGRKPGLERIGTLCGLLGDPQKELKFIHVAGTNGKGSVSAMTDSILRAAGLKVGLYTSPYLVDFTERIQFDGKPISHETLCRITEEVKEKADLMEDGPTEFELITAIAFRFYKEVKPDLIVLECGLGGRLDATNIISESLVSAITNIALDHTDVLGDTEEKIAGEKAGILKGAPCVLGSASPGAEEVIREKCREKGICLVKADRIGLKDVKHTRDGIYFRYGETDLFAPLSGVYQEKNIKTVLAITEELKKIGYDLSGETLRKGFGSVYW